MMRSHTLDSREGERVDIFVSAGLDALTRSAVQKLCEEGQVLVDGCPVSKNYRLKAGQVITIRIPELRAAELIPEDIPLAVCYEDDDLLVVDKPKGMVVHPAPGHYSGTLVHALMYHCAESLSGINGVARPGIVHRIDKDTSGLLIVAKHDAAHDALARQIQEHTFTREYQAVVYGTIKEDSGAVDAPIGRHPVKRKQMAVIAGGRAAVTHYEVIARYRGFTHLRITLETGRTHQIRVHMASRGHPVAGDALYGPQKVIARLEGQCLHAGLIGFRHPSTRTYIECSSPLPAYFTSFLSGLQAE